MISRRKFLQLSAISGFIPYAAHASWMRNITMQSSGISGIQAIPSSDPKFFDYLNKYFPNLSRDQKFAKLIPVSVILVNNYLEPLFGLKVSWEGKTDKNATDICRRTFIKSPTTQLKLRKQTCDTPLLLNGSVGLITPLFFWSSEYYKKKYLNSTYVGSPVKRVKMRRYKAKHPLCCGFLRKMSMNSALNITISGAVYSSKQFGVDSKKIIKLAHTYINAEHDEANKLYRSSLNKNGKLDGTLLIKNINKSINIAKLYTSNKNRKYVISRGNFARKVGFMANTTDFFNVENLLLKVMKTKNMNGRSSLFV